MMSVMRTTLTIDDDVAARLKELAHRRRASFKETVNAVLRRGLSAQDRTDAEPYETDVFRSGFRPGVDIARLNQLSDHLEVDDATSNGDEVPR